MNRWGSPDKDALFLLHANGFSAKLYRSFVKPLEADFDIWAPDLPGHGESRWNGRIQAWTDLADYFIKHLEKSPPVKPMVGMGHSIGGIVIMLMALQRPEWFSKIILLDPVMLPKRILLGIRFLRLFSMTHIIPLAKTTKRRKRQFGSRQLALEHYSKKAVFSRWAEGVLKDYVDSCLYELAGGSVQLACAPQLESSIYQSIPVNVWSFPKKLHVPALFIIGEYSDTVSPRGYQRLKRLRGNHVVKGINGGHLFPFEKPDECIDLIKEYLSQ